MTLLDLKEHISSFPEGTQFNFGLSAPFSWRGSYNEVAFSILTEPTKRENILANIEAAYVGIFFGYKGGEYTYGDYTTVNFEEEGSRNYSDGRYVAEMIATIEGVEAFSSQEERLVKIAFK